ncbi:MAG: hypothetical protein C6H99_02600 [Epsilonproteobacteria bacterium]|nr:hypothetical protein [Campylobacterota bacterium]NPA64222.1 hypothetical protein [Campylobacterota bacterium]
MARINRKKPFRPRCKYCRTNKFVVPIVYGARVSEELLEKEQKDEIVLGGVARSVDAPNWHCKGCGWEFLR